MKTEHTQGEWLIAKNDEKTIYAHGDTCIAVVESSNGINEAKANAHLIAAAPKLLEALGNLLNCVDGQHDQEWLDRARHEAKAALSLATGEQS